MAKRDSFLLRVDPSILEALRRWSDDELRSMNGQIEFLLSHALRDAGRMPTKPSVDAKKPCTEEVSESRDQIEEAT